MATDKLNIQDKVELDKFTKFLALKSTQIIVQSRLGKKIQTHCKPNSSGNDWFNLAIQDLPDVLAEAKRALCEVGLVTARLPLCVEISLKTVEGDSMALETWSLEVRPEQRDTAVLVKNAVYDRMGILLKSLVSVTRVTPAYKLSRRQGPDSYVICYVIYLGEAQLHKLGEGYKEVMVGQLCTAVGTICLSVSYRTKMTISPQHTGRDNSIMLKSDHFNPDLSPRHLRYQQSEDNNASLSETIKVGAFAEGNRVTRELLEPDMMMPEVPFSNLMTPRQQHSPSRAPPDLSERGDSPSDDGNGNTTPCNESRRSSCSMVSANEDFIMVDLKAPFAGSNANSDLGAFFRDCQSAPPLKTFSEQAAEPVDIGKTLEAFETSMREYDDMLQSLCISDNNN